MKKRRPLLPLLLLLVSGLTVNRSPSLASPDPPAALACNQMYAQLLRRQELALLHFAVSSYPTLPSSPLFTSLRSPLLSIAFVDSHLMLVAFSHTHGATGRDIPSSLSSYYFILLIHPYFPRSSHSLSAIPQALPSIFFFPLPVILSLFPLSHSQQMHGHRQWRPLL